MERDIVTRQLEVWRAEFGRDYTDRNPIAVEDMDRELGEYCGCGRKSDLFREFVPTGRISTGRVLEVGSNVGVQLKILQSVNPGLELYAVEPMKYALDKGRGRYPDVTFVPGTAFDLPFKDDYFDVVMTNGVLIHIDPVDLPKALDEIHRVSRRYIHFQEYFAEQLTEIQYRGEMGLMWKTDFMKRYLDRFPDLRSVQVRYLHYADPVTAAPLVDQVALLEKRVAP